MTEASPTLEQRLDRLDEIVRTLERDDLELEKALQLFEEGVAHLRHAQELLATAELRIERLLEGRP
jgi:exodeoxyribonuclease VII small subunit